MSTDKKGVLAKIKESLAAFKAVKRFKMLLLTAGNGDNIDFASVGEDEVPVADPDNGSIGTIDGVPAEGEYVMAGEFEGQTFVFLAGMLIEIKPAAEAARAAEEGDAQTIADLEETVSELYDVIETMSDALTEAEAILESDGSQARVQNRAKSKTSKKTESQTVSERLAELKAKRKGDKYNRLGRR